MRTKILAGVAAVAFSVVPVAGTLAVDCSGTGGASLTDTINMTITSGCAFSRTVGNGTYAVEMAWNATNNNAATETFKVVCNDAAGFKVTGTFSSFTGPGSPDSNIAYTNAAPNAGQWTAVKGGSNSTTYMQSGSAGNLMSATAVTSTSGQTQQVTYKIHTGAQQPRGSYSATATYVATSNT